MCEIVVSLSYKTPGFRITIQKEPPIETGPHLTEADIAAYLDSALDEVETARVRQHIDACKECRELFLDAARVRAAWDADSASFKPSSEQIELAMAVHARHEDGRRSDVSRKPGRGRARGFDIKKLAVAAVIVVAVVGIWFGVVDHESSLMLDENYLTSVRSAVETASSNGMIVLPGGERNLSPAPSTYRSGIVQASNGLEESLEYLYDVFSEDKTNRDAAFWLVAGYLATGQIESGRDFAREAQSLYPSDREIITLSGLAAYMGGNYAEAENLLRKVLEIDPDNPVALVDLSLVLIDRNKPREIKTLLRGVVTRHPNTPLARRAEQILSDLVSE